MHRRPYWNKVTAVVLTVVLTGVFSPAFAAKSDPTPGPDRKLDGETLFRGLYFGQGPAARYFPEIWKNPRVIEALKNADMSRSIEGQNLFMDFLRQEDATVFTRFGEDMQSGDQIRVRDAMVSLGHRMRTIATERMGMDERTIGAPSGVNGQCVVLAVVVAVVVAVAVAAAVAIVVYLYIDLWGPDVEHPDLQQTYGSRLERDMWVDTLTHRLHPSAAQ